MVRTRNTLDLSKSNIHLVSNQPDEEQLNQLSISYQNHNMADLNDTSASCQVIKSDPSTIKIDSSPSSFPNTLGTKMTVQPELENQILTTTTTVSQVQPKVPSTNNNEHKDLARIPYYNGKTNIYAWLTAIKSVFVDLNYNASTWANKAKYYLLDDAAHFVYVNDDQMTDWETFQKLMIDQYSPVATTSDPTYSPANIFAASDTIPQQYTTHSSDALAVKAHHALVLEDLKSLPKFSDEHSESINSWLDEIELVYDKAFVIDSDKCYRTLKLLSDTDHKWLEFIRRQKLDWNELKHKLISRFENKKNPSRIQLEDDIRNRRYHDNESMHQYYSDIMRKCDLLEEEYPVAARHRIDYIIRGLPDNIQDQLLIREYSTPKELLEVLPKIEERRKRITFEQQVICDDETVVGSMARVAPTLQTTFLRTNNVRLNTPVNPQPARYSNKPFYNSQSQIYRSPSNPLPNYNQVHFQKQRSVQCYNCGKFGHKAKDCFKPKQHLN